MKECAAYGGVTAHSVMEAVYEHPQWIIDSSFWMILKLFYTVCSELTCNEVVFEYINIFSHNMVNLITPGVDGYSKIPLCL